MKDQALGASILLFSVLGILFYGWIVLFSQWSILVLQLTALLVVGGVLAIAAWIGWAMATTPPPGLIESLEETTTPEEKIKKAGDESGH
ncbi:MAG: transcriptional regulator [Candidatus Bathyarchaeota archaeon]